MLGSTHMTQIHAENPTFLKTETFISNNSSQSAKYAKISIVWYSKFQGSARGEKAYWSIFFFNTVQSNKVKLEKKVDFDSFYQQ